ncbi:hypothetical protein D3C79_856470 [compost metagenome]
MGITEQRAAFLEITRAERLQRVVLSQRMQQLLARLLAVAATGQSPTCSEVIAQLAYEHGCRALAIIADAPADPADVQLIARGQQRFEQQVTVILAARAVAGAVVTGHQVEVQRLLGARVIAIVHAKQADHSKRDGTHRHEGAEVY